VRAQNGHRVPAENVDPRHLVLVGAGPRMAT
jgi:hypothetical protein